MIQAYRVFILCLFLAGCASTRRVARDSALVSDPQTQQTGDTTTVGSVTGIDGDVDTVFDAGTAGDTIAPSDSDYNGAGDSASNGNGSAAAADEEAFQDGIEALFSDSALFPLDSFALDSTRINSGRFNSTEWTDTARIPLVDSARGLYYVHPAAGHVTSNFGQRRYLWHYGIDTKLFKGDTVRVAFPGVVRVIQYDRRGYGQVVVVRHHGGLETIYGHLSKKLVAPGQNLKAGEVIGLGGNTGRSTGSHLHFEVRYRGEPFDPNTLVDFAAYAVRSDTLILTRANFEYLVELRKMKWCSVRRGDTLGHIARRYHTTVSKLCSLNGISRKTLLRIGRKLRYQ